MQRDLEQLKRKNDTQMNEQEAHLSEIRRTNQLLSNRKHELQTSKQLKETDLLEKEDCLNKKMATLEAQNAHLKAVRARIVEKSEIIKDLEQEREQ